MLNTALPSSLVTISKHTKSTGRESMRRIKNTWDGFVAPRVFQSCCSPVICSFPARGMVASWVRWPVSSCSLFSVEAFEECLVAHVIKVFLRQCQVFLTRPKFGEFACHQLEPDPTGWWWAINEGSHTLAVDRPSKRRSNHACLDTIH